MGHRLRSIRRWTYDQRPLSIFGAVALALIAQARAADEGSDKFTDAITKGVLTQELLKTMTYDQVPAQWRTKVRDESTTNIAKKVFWRGNQRVLEVFWRKDWVGTNSRMFIANVYSGKQRIGSVNTTPDISISQRRDAPADYSMTTTIKDDGKVSIMFTGPEEYLEVVELKGRDTHLMDDIEYTRMAVGIKQVVGPIFDRMRELRTNSHPDQTKRADPASPAQVR